MDVRASSRVAKASPTPDVARRSVKAIDRPPPPQLAASTRERDERDDLRIFSTAVFFTGLFLSASALLVAAGQALLSGRIRE